MSGVRKKKVHANLYHATDRVSARHIAREGFKPRVGNFGKATYLAATPGTARARARQDGHADTSLDTIIKVPVNITMVQRHGSDRGLTYAKVKRHGAVWVTGEPTGIDTVEYARYVRPGANWRPRGITFLKGSGHGVDPELRAEWCE